MYQPLLLTHSLLRFALLALLTAVALCALFGWQNKKPFSPVHNMLGLLLLIAAHLQLLLGLSLYLVSPQVRFEAASMKDPISRYWLAEHLTMMIIAIALITVARIRGKKTANDELRHKQLFIWNASALALIVIAILMSGRAFFGLTM